MPTRRILAVLSAVLLVGSLLPTAAIASRPPAPQGLALSDLVTPLKVVVDPDQIRPSAMPGTRTVPEGLSLPTAPAPARTPTADEVAQLRETTRGGDAPGIDSLSDPIVNVPGTTSNANPPDTNGDVGANHYVQMNNAGPTGGQTVYQIFDKAGNDLSGGSVRFGGLWPSGATCNSDKGDPIVVYDHLADRWLLSQFADPNHMCVAISQTPDPTANSWFLYTFNTTVFPDYPHFGVWPDGYYMSSYEGANLGAYVFDRTNMLLGNAAGFFKDTIPSLGEPGVRDTRILPADLDGPAPPFGTPNYFARTVDDQQDSGDPTDRIEVYEFEVDWVFSTASFTLVQTLDAGDGLAPFDIMTCDRGGGGVRDCIPEPDTTSTVDALSNRPMAQLKYRLLDGDEVMVFNQTINIQGSIPPILGFTPVNEVAGIRWYEVRKPGASWSIEQQGTYGPQPNGATTEEELLHRWMGSAAIDRDGNIALGFSIVNDDDTNGQEVYPSIRYAGRRFDDLPGQMAQGEKSILAGTNSQTGGSGRRWGDYSALSVDPVDDCTFWYTTHVAGSGGTGARPTQIASFRFDTCRTELAITKTATPADPNAGEELVYTVNVDNIGLNDAHDVVVMDMLPAEVTYVSDTDSCGGVAVGDTGTLTCPLGTIPAGGSVSFEITVFIPPSVPDGTILTNTAVVTASDADGAQATVMTTVSTEAELWIEKSGEVTAGNPANVITYLITVHNEPGSAPDDTPTSGDGGPSDALNVVVSDPLPLTSKKLVVQFLSPSCSYDEPTHTVTCSTPTLPVGTSVTYEIQVKVKGSVGTITNTATVSSSTFDPVLSNNSDTVNVVRQGGTGHGPTP